MFCADWDVSLRRIGHIGTVVVMACHMYMVAQKKGAIESNCKYSEKSMTELRRNIANICLLAYLLTVVCLDDITLTCTCVMDFVVLFTVDIQQ